MNLKILKTVLITLVCLVTLVCIVLLAGGLDNPFKKTGFGSGGGGGGGFVYNGGANSNPGSSTAPGAGNEDGNHTPNDSVTESTNQNSEPSEEDIRNAYDNMHKFYMEWIYGQLYVKNYEVNEYTGKLRGPVSGTEINTSEKLIGAIKDTFCEPVASRYVADLNPKDENGVLYINTVGGVGDTYTKPTITEIVKSGANNYILTLNYNDIADTSSYVCQIICENQNGKLLFANYQYSSLKTRSDYHDYYNNSVFGNHDHQ